MSEPKTKPTDASVEDFLAAVEPARRRDEGRTLCALMQAVSGEAPVMWGPSMIGYGQMHYRYATGREGDTFRVGFSPRKAKLTLYGLPHEERFLDRLGKHTTSVACLYVNKPEDIDLAVLEEMIREAWNSGT